MSTVVVTIHTVVIAGTTTLKRIWQLIVIDTHILYENIFIYKSKE